MKQLRFSLSILVFVTLSFLCHESAQALSVTTFVSRNGSDSNPCSISAPCRTFQAAVDATAAGGKVIALDSGGYSPVTINKSVTIYGGNTFAFITAPAKTVAVTINAGSSDVVTLNGLALCANGGTVGIGFLSGAVVHVENSIITGFQNAGIAFGFAGQLFVKDTIVRNIMSGKGVGIVVAGGATASLDHCRMEHNQTGLLVGDNSRVTVRESVAAGNQGNGYEVRGSTGVTPVLELQNSEAVNNGDVGLFVKGGGKATASDSRFSTNSASGIVVVDSGSQATVRSCISSTNTDGFAAVFNGELNIEGSTAANNSLDGMSVNGGTLRVSNSMSTDNGEFGFHNFEGALESRGNNTVRGNLMGDTVGTIKVIAGT